MANRSSFHTKLAAGLAAIGTPASAADASNQPPPASAPGALLAQVRTQASADNWQSANEGKLRELAQSLGTAQLIKPDLIDIWQGHDRFEDLIHRGADWDEFKAQIQATNGNVQPILVVKKGERYELYYGRRRKEACQEIGLPVLAVIMNQEVDAKSAWKYMRLENTGGKPLSVVEKAHSFAAALDRCGFKTQAELAQASSESQSVVSLLLSLAKIDLDVLRSLGDIRDITYAHARQLVVGWGEKPDSMKSRAVLLKEQKLNSIDQRLRFLLGVETEEKERAHKKLLQDGAVLTYRRKQIVIDLPEGALDIGRDTLRPTLERLLKQLG